LFLNDDKNEDVEGIVPHEIYSPYLWLLTPALAINLVVLVEDESTWIGEEDYENEDEFAYSKEDEEEFDEEYALENGHIDENLFQRDDEKEQAIQGSFIQDMDSNLELPYIEYPSHVSYNFILNFLFKIF